MNLCGAAQITLAHRYHSAQRSTRRPASHKDVAQQFNDRRLHHKSEAMVDLLGEISAEEHAVGRPLLSAVVVRKAEALPIPGPGVLPSGQGAWFHVQGRGQGGLLEGRIPEGMHIPMEVDPRRSAGVMV